MKNLFKNGLLSIAILALTACGTGEVEEGTGGIDTGDVKGDIDLMGARGQKLSYSYNGNDCKAYKVELNDGAELLIFPDDRDFAEQKGEIERKTKSSFYDIEIINSDDDFIFWKETKTPWGKEKKAEKTGYGFIRIVKKNDSMNYILESNGETPLDPIWNKADAEKLIKIAKSFKAKN